MLKGKTAISGSTSGIGQGMARALAKAGANVMLNGLGDAAQIEKDRAAMEQETGSKIAYSNGADMTKPDQIADLLRSKQMKPSVQLISLSTMQAFNTLPPSMNSRRRNGT